MRVIDHPAVNAKLVEIDSGTRAYVGPAAGGGHQATMVLERCTARHADPAQALRLLADKLSTHARALRLAARSLK